MNTEHYTHAIRTALSVCAAVALVGSLQAAQSSTGMLKKSDRDFVIRAAVLNQEEVRLSQLAVTRASNADVRAYAQKIISDHQSSGSKLAQLATTRGVSLAGLEQSAAMSTEARTRLGSSPAGSSTAGSSTATTTPGTPTDSTRTTTTTTTTPAASEAVAEEIREGLESIREKEAELAKKTGQDFDEAYMEAMVKGHAKAIDLYRDCAANKETDSELAAFASGQVESLRQHHQQAQTLEKAVSG